MIQGSLQIIMSRWVARFDDMLALQICMWFMKLTVMADGVQNHAG